MILRCADGLPSKDVAEELGVHEHTVGKWRRRLGPRPDNDFAIHHKELLRLVQGAWFTADLQPGQPDAG